MPYRFRADSRCGGCVVKKLDYGDYMIDGHPELVVVERKKNVDELCSNFGRHRDRFKRELERMGACRWRYVVVEDSLRSAGDMHFSRMHPNAFLASVIAFELRYGVRFIFADNRKWAHRVTKQILLRAHAEMVKESQP